MSRYEDQTIECRMCNDEISYVHAEDMPDKEYFTDCLEHWTIDELRDEVIRLRRKEAIKE